ncbi:hypothetical protein GH714_022663 [Hevea brasiliensis]|uniref:Methyltransferase type 11 domain-containing protein n=1 Tax=Hevea brasiliensis TaxID=3981 RepID=A0A6A6KKB4_HEVBR|nr:hypothetical protein GH714_022663 [Hevea brasiliensis]
MGKREKQPSQSSSDELLKALGDFTSKENWDKFFTIRGSDDSFEWYAEWTELRQPLLSLLDGAPPTGDHDNTLHPNFWVQILVPGCGNSRLSEHLYDAGFKDITNIDFSKVVISDMLRRNVRGRPGMRWRVMDMTSMQFADETFDAILDKGGLDALMEPELGPKLGTQYLSEVQRVLKSGGKFICLTLAESHVLGLLFSKFRFGWKMSVHAIPQKPSSKPRLCTFMVVAEKDISTDLLQITSSFDHRSLDCSGNQAAGLHEAVENENRIRREYSSGSDILYSLEDLQLGAKGDLTKLSRGRRFQLTLGGQGCSRFTYRAVLLDAKDNSVPFSYHCGVFIVPKTRAHEWLFSSEEGQWLVIESSKAARLIVVILDSSHANASMDDIQKDLSLLVKQLAPGKDDNGSQIPFMMASDGIKQRHILHKVTSSLTGPIIVEDVVYENVDGDVSRLFPSKDLIFRRLVFQRTEGLVQSEALLTSDESSHKVVEIERKKTSSSKSKKRGNQKRNDEPSNRLKVYHDYLASSYHTGIISGFMLISSYLESVLSAGNTVNTVVVGLGAGLLPMFLHGCMPFLHIEVVELDPVILNLARDYFGFAEDKFLKVHIADGIEFVREVNNFARSDRVPVLHRNEDASGNSKSSSDGSCVMSYAEGSINPGLDVLIIDVDSSDSSSGMTCPAADFVEESFLLTVKDSLSEQGLFVVNLVSRSSSIKDMVIERMKMGKEIINSDSNGVTSENSLPMPKETLNLQGSSSSVMESGIQSITLGVFSPTLEAINTDAWTKDEDEQNFEEKISRSLKHFNSQSDGNDDQDPTLNLNSSIRDGCLEEESFGIQDDIRINSADKNIEILKGMLLGPRLVKIFGSKKVVSLAENVFIKGEDMEVNEEEKYWNLGGSIFELRSCNHMILKENEFEIWRRQREKINSLSRDDCIGNLCCNDKVNCKSVMRFDKKNSAESIFPFAENVKEKYEMASIYGWTSSGVHRSAVPKFGNWESEENVPYTVYFEKARKERTEGKMNRNYSEENPDIFNTKPPIHASSFQMKPTEAQKVPEAVRSKHEHLSQEEIDLRRSTDSSLHHDDVGKRDVTKVLRANHEHGEHGRDRLRRPTNSVMHHDTGAQRVAADSNLHHYGGVSSSDTHRRIMRWSAASDLSTEQSHLHPRNQPKIGGKGNAVSSLSWERKGSSEGTHGLAPMTPGRSRLRSVTRGNDSPDHSAVPKFGEWDETDPASADGYTHIFNKVREEKQGGAAKVPDLPTESSQSHGHKQAVTAFPGEEDDVFVDVIK